jgi:pyruvate/2-oxoglutarate dehydrogenase complex dihydrolipoamide dehydrogenase (E3) component
VLSTKRSVADGRKAITARLGDGFERTFACDEILVAAGRRANTGGLGLERAGVELDGEGSVVTDARGSRARRTSGPAAT